MNKNNVLLSFPQTDILCAPRCGSAVSIYTTRQKLELTSLSVMLELIETQITAAFAEFYF